ncbi:MAG: hypothetical protein LUG87_05050, partial [Oscillospiraceae bacterium]|nr:hypothetical protein [Oscillospiraceae bacterium]
MNNRFIKKVVQFLVAVFISTLLIMGISVFAEGMYLIGVPDIDDVQKVTISYSEVTSEIKESSDAEQFELAVKLSGFLKYSLT